MITLKEAFAKKYPTTAKRILSIWEDATGEKATFEGITKPNLAAFTDELCTQVAPSSAKTYSAQFKAVLNLYADDLPKGWEKALTVKKDVSEQVYLTDEEVQRVISHKARTRNEATVQQQFILSCLIGARHGDIVRLTANNIRDGYVCYVSEKTHIKAQVPLSDVARHILMGDYRNRAHQIFDDDIEKQAYQERVCDNTFNSILRNICKECGIDEEMTLYKRGATVTAPKYTFVSSHTGRRTCATLLYLHGCDIYTISRILAHSSVEMTAQKYILCPVRQLSEETMAYFSQFV